MFVNPFINTCSTIYNWVIWIGSNLQSLLLLLIRIIWGHQFVISGYAKFIDPDKAIKFFATLGLTPNTVYLVAAIELFFGLLFLIGFASRLAAIPLIVTMISAIALAHSHVFANFDFIMNPALLVTQAPFPFLIASLIVFVFGPGRISLDGWIKRLSRNWRQY